MKIIFKKLLFLFLVLFTFNNIYTKNSLLSLSKTKQKIENALSNAITVTKENIKDFFNIKDNKKEDKNNSSVNKNEEEKEIDQKPDYYQELAPKIEKMGNKIISDKKLWCQQEEFIKNLKEVFSKSKEEANLLIANKIKEKYNKSNSPVIDFVYDIKKEEDSLKEVSNKIERLKEKKEYIKNDNIYLKLINLISPINKLQNNLQDLIFITNKLLTY